MANYTKHTWTSGEIISASLLNAIENQLETITPGATIISNNYNASTAYTVGQYCLHNGNLWKCKTASTGHTPEEGTYWTATTVMDEIRALGG